MKLSLRFRIAGRILRGELRAALKGRELVETADTLDRLADEIDECHKIETRHSGAVADDVRWQAARIREEVRD